MQRNLNRHVHTPTLTEGVHSASKLNAPISTMFRTDLRKPIEIYCTFKWGWCYRSTRKRQTCPRWHNSPLEGNDSPGRTTGVITTNHKEGNSHCQVRLHPPANGQENVFWRGQTAPNERMLREQISGGTLPSNTKRKAPRGAHQSEESMRKPQGKEKKNVIQEPSSLANEITLQSLKSKN